MKQSEAAAFLPLIKAWSEGKTLQVKQIGGTWGDIDFNASLTSSPDTYRIKPEPIVRYATMYDNMRNMGGCYTTEDAALMWADSTSGGKVIRLIQDLDYVPPAS